MASNSHRRRRSSPTSATAALPRRSQLSASLPMRLPASSSRIPRDERQLSNYGRRCRQQSESTLQMLVDKFDIFAMFDALQRFENISLNSHRMSVLMRVLRFRIRRMIAQSAPSYN